MSAFSKILIVDDEKNTCEGLAQFLEALDYDVLTASSGEDGWKIYQQEKPDLILSDIKMPGMGGIELLEKIKRANPRELVILLTAYGSVEDAVQSMKKGAYYYLTKPVNLEELELLVKKALKSRELEEENQELKTALFSERFEEGEIQGNSSVIKNLLNKVDQVAKSNATVLIEGESGTGKELIAHRIHEKSGRAHHSFVAVHCAALTETLLASELFGHERGAFTGAYERKIGRFEKAHQGTLFLDEIGEISPETQVKLLRVLQGGEFERVGGTKTIKVNVRLVCATNKNLTDEVAKGKFREDLYYRINVIYLKVPPLRERKEDIPLLAHSFLKHFARLNVKKITTLDADALEVLKKYPWPGNIRELKNILERMVVLSTKDKITLDLVPEDIRRSSVSGSPAFAPASAPVPASIPEMEKELIIRTLAEVKGNKSIAAKKLGISRRTLYRKLDEYRLE
ncbi:MAG: sigma-54-dependent Fis family transcriptional regulator [Candidatus Omnitrophica bacterium]|nr:sigma-54-dependent Fis family transcriptional regulator [Candidatus Omnitrophota bacterium]